jgi:hypothetical protein
MVEEMNSNNLVVTTFVALRQNFQYLFLMLGIYEDFDDDLLYDVVYLLTN